MILHISHRGGVNETLVIVSDMVFTDEGTIYGGTSDKGLFRYEIESGKMKFFDVSNSGIPGNNVKSLVYDSDEGKLWLSMFVGGVAVLDLNSGKFSRVSLPAYDDSRETTDISCRLYRHGNTIYAATYAGVYGIDMQTHEASKILNRSRVFDLVAGDGGTLYLVTEQNCFEVWDRAEDGAYVRTSSYLMEDNLINRLHADPEGRIWLATIRSGAVLYDPSDASMTVFDMASCGIESNMVSSIAGLPSGMMLLGTSAGLSLLDADSFRTENFSVRTGFPISTMDEGCICIFDGKIACGSMDGIVVFNENDMSRIPDVYPVYFASLTVDGNTVAAGDHTGILSCALQYTESIVLNYDCDIMDFHIGTHISAGFNPADFQYRLFGYDEAWNPLESGVIRYMNLSPGKYSLTLRSRPNRLCTGPESVTIDIRIRPPFYATAAAWVLYVMVIVAVTASILHFYYSRKQLQWKLAFFTDISHEFRTPLTMIIGQMDVAMREKLPEKAVGLISSAKRNALKLKSLVEELIDLRRQEQGVLTLKIGTCDYCGFISDVCSDFEGYATIRNMDFRCLLPAVPVYGEFDPVQFRKVLNNLIGNAFKHTPDGGRISVVLVQEKDDTVVISVSDTGEGIPKDRIGTVFEKFVHYSSGPSDTGMGIGLALTKSIVTLHHGSISVSSEQGEGAVFTVKLQCHPDFSNDRNVEKATERDFLKRDPVHGFVYPEGRMSDESSLPSLLVVEDEPELRELFVSVFSPYWKVLTAADGCEGMKKAGTLYPDLILSDVMMPGMSGTELCRRLKNDFATSHIPVVLLTALTASENVVEGLNCGADDYIVKPFDTDVLLAKCNAIYRNRRILMKKYADGTKELPAAISSNRKDAEFAGSVHALIRKNIDNENISVEFLCRELGMSRTALFSKFKGVFGQTPTELVSSVRLKEACRLLIAEPEMKIAAIADAVGINSVQYFGKLFRHRFGMTPSEYRNSHRSGAPAL